MPCSDWGYERCPDNTEANKVKKLTQMLCATFHTIERMHYGRVTDFFEDYDEYNLEEECGVGRKEILAWWREHQKEDEIRKTKEAKQKEDKAIREAALAKLTPKERKMLGL